MTMTDTAGAAAEAAEESARKVARTAKRTARKASGSAKETAGKAGTSKAAGSVRTSTKKAVAGARATKAAKAGMVEEARQIAAEAGTDAAADAIAQVDAMHYQVEVNKRGLSVTALTKTLNERWENGWRLAHVLEQRGNTVLVFEKRE